MKKILFYLLLMFSVIGVSAYAEDVLVLGTESMPWCGTVDGQSTGMTVEILNEATKYGAPNFEFRLDLPWARSQEMVHEQKGALVVIIPLTRTTQRENNYKWISLLAPNQIMLVTYDRKTPVTSIEEAKDLRIAAVRGLSDLPRLKELGFTKIDESSSNAVTNAKKLLNKRVDAIIDASWVLAYTWKGLGQNSKDLQPGPKIAEPSYVYLGADPSFPDDVAKEIADAIDKMRKDGKLQEILNKWM